MTQQRPTPAVPERHTRPEPPDVQRIRFMANCISTRGVLRRFVPKEPGWFRSIGDDIRHSLDNQRRLHPQELEHLTEVFNTAHSADQAKVLKLKPKRNQALLLRRLVEHGIAYWDAQYVDFPELQGHAGRTGGTA